LQAEAPLSPAWLKTHARAIVACLFSALAFTALPTPADSYAGASARFDGVERQIIRKINRIRSGSGLARLRSNAALGRSSDFHCADMLQANFFAHTSSNGDSFEQRVEQFRPSNRIGETLAYLSRGARRHMARRIVDMWMNSPPHRASLLSPSFRRIGVARRNGRLNGAPVTVFTADFASKR
jgi:uncharacterized protein YkwD